MFPISIAHLSSVMCGHAFDRTFKVLYLKFNERNELKTTLLLLFIAGLYTHTVINQLTRVGCQQT